MADVTPFKRMLFLEVRKYDVESASMDDIALNKHIFHYPDSLRLSTAGFMIIKKQFTAYSFEMPEGIKAKHQMALSKMDFPYALRRKRLIVFSELDASVIKLSGSVQNFLETYSQA
jgi:hypothetical protein